MEDHTLHLVTKCNKRLFLLRQLDNLKVDSTILCTLLYYHAMRILAKAAGSWYNSCGTTLLQELARILKWAAKLIGQDDWATLMMPETLSVYKLKAVSLYKKNHGRPSAPHPQLLQVATKWSTTSHTPLQNKLTDTGMPSFITNVFSGSANRARSNKCETEP